MNAEGENFRSAKIINEMGVSSEIKMRIESLLCQKVKFNGSMIQHLINGNRVIKAQVNDIT